MAFRYQIRSREQWDARASGGGGDFESWLTGEYRIFKPLAGENRIRILPPSPNWENPQHYGMDVWVHYSVGPDRASVICLFKHRKGNCPICEDRVRAERAKDEDLARDLRAAKRTLVLLLNMKDAAQGPLAWGMPKTLDDAIAKVAKDRATGEYYFIDSDEAGYDIYFDKTGEGLNTRYNGVALAKKPSALPERILDWLEDHPLPEALHWRDYDEVKRLHVGAGRGEAPDEVPTTSTRRGGGSGGGDDGGRRSERSERDTWDRDRPRHTAPERRQEPVDIDDEIPPFDTDPPKARAEPPRAEPQRAEPPKAEAKTEAPSGNGKSRADQLRERLAIN